MIKNRYYPLFITFAVLVLFGVSLMTFVPKLTLWSRTYSNETSRYVNLKPGQSVSVEFPSPCDNISCITVDLQGVTAYDAPIDRIDAGVVLEDLNGNTITSASINSVYENSINTGSVSLARGDRYVLRLFLDCISGETESVGVGVTDSGELSFSVRGVNNGVPDKTAFPVVYSVFCLLVLMYVYSLTNPDLKKTDIMEKVLFAAGVVMAVVFVNQYFDLFITAKCGLRMIDSVKAGEFFSYYDHAYNAELVNGSPSKFFGYNYNVLLVLPVAVAMIPFSFFTDGNMDFGPVGDLAVWYLDILVAALIVLSVKLTGRVCDACGMPNGYKRSVKLIYAFSPLVLYVSIGFGQIDIIYVLIMLMALPFYYIGKYKTFSLIMAFAVVMKLIPFLVFVPMILLVNKKIRDITINTLICLSVKLVTMLIFERGTGYGVITSIITEWHDFTGLLFENRIDTRSVFVTLFAGICVYCYLKVIDTSDKKKLLYSSMLVIFLVYAAFAGFVDVHQQWLIPLILSLAYIVPFFGRDRRTIILAAAIEMLLILIHTDNSDSIYMIENGMLAIDGYRYQGIPVTEILTNITPVAVTLIRSVIAVLLLGLAVILARKDPVHSESELAVDRTFAVGRVVLLYLYFVLCFWCYCYVG